jgi:hypothetical protein
VAGSFNNWQPTAAYAMKKILPRQNFGRTYWFSHSCYVYVSVLVVDQPMAGTPSLVKTADPYSTLVLSPLMMEVFRLQVILPAYPVGQEREKFYKQENPYAWCGNNKFCETS